jgi:hypothetical protein
LRGRGSVEVKFWLIRVSVTHVLLPGLTMADCEIFCQRSEEGFTVVQSPLQGAM